MEELHFRIPEKDTFDCKNPSNIFEGIILANNNCATGDTNKNEHSSILMPYYNFNLYIIV